MAIFGFMPPCDSSSLVMHPKGTNSEMTSSAYLIRTDHSDVVFVSLYEHRSRGKLPAPLVLRDLVPRSRCSLYHAPEQLEHLVLGAVYVIPPRNTNICSVRLYTGDLVPSLCVGARCSLCHAPERCQPSTVFRTSVPSVYRSRSIRTN